MAMAASSNGTPAAEPATPVVNGKGHSPGFTPLVCVVDFHHARGPEVERWFGVAEGTDPAAENDWTLLPFMALSDGAHASTEDFSYFTLLKPASDSYAATSLFGISCTRQMDAAQLLVRPSDVTRSTVQKAVVVIADSPQSFGMLRERLSAATTAWFAQREFIDVEILQHFQESLADEKARGMLNEGVDRDEYLGLNLRELIREFRWQTLVLLKCCLLQPKMLFFGSRCERLCMMQFSLVSLIPGLLRNLEDCAGPDLNSYEKKLTKPTTLKTSDRSSLLAYMGLPLQLFGKGSLFGPYTPLQQLDVLADFGTKSYIVGSTNSLLLQQRDRYSDILINLDDGTINITSPSLRTALQLSVADRRWIDVITQEVNDTWDESNPGRPKTLGYRGSEEYIRIQFEEYLLSLISSAKYHEHLVICGHNPRKMLPHVEGDPSADYGAEFVDYWARTENHRLWTAKTDSHLFDIIEPKHPCAGGLTVADVQNRITQQVQDLHLDERFAQGKEVLGSTLAAGKERASTMLNKLYSDMEGLKSQRKRAEEAQLLQDRRPPHLGPGHERSASGFSAVDLAKAQQTMQSVGVKAGAYMSSWAAWAGEKRRASGWGGRAGAGAPSPASTLGGGGGGWGLKKRGTMSSTTSDASSEKDLQFASLRSPRMSVSSTTTGVSESEKVTARPLTQASFGESVLDGAASEVSASDAASIRNYPHGGPASPLSGGGESTPPSVSRGMDSVVVAAAAAPAASSNSGSPERERNGEAKAAVRGVSPPPIPEEVAENGEGEVLAEGKEGEAKPAKEARVVGPVGSKVMLRP